MIIFPVNADDEELIKEYEKLNGVTINIFALNQEAYSEDCTSYGVQDILPITLFYMNLVFEDDNEMKHMLFNYL